MFGKKKLVKKKEEFNDINELLENKHRKTYCEKCKSTKNLTYNTWPVMKTYCDKCWEISLDGVMMTDNSKLSKQWSYAWNHGVQENGVEWYKEARDKIIQKRKELKLREEEKSKKDHKDMKESIDKLKTTKRRR